MIATNLFDIQLAEACAIDTSYAGLPDNDNPIEGISHVKEIIVSEQDVEEQLASLVTSKSYGISPMFLKHKF